MKGVIDEPQARKLAVPATIDFYHQAYELGLIDRQCELLEGLIVRKMPKSPLHQALADYLAELLRQFLSASYLVRTEGPIAIPSFNSVPEPDVSVVTGQRQDYLENHPKTADLVAEISITTTAMDRQKARIYAAAGVKEFWLILPEKKTIEVFSKPDTDSQCYQQQQVFENTFIKSESLVGFSLLLPHFFELTQ